MEHARCHPQHRGLRTTVHLNLGLPRGGRLPPFVVVHRLILAHRLHDATKRRLNQLTTPPLGRRVKGRRHRPVVQWQPTVTTQRSLTI